MNEEELADEHWEFLKRWMGMAFKDGFTHGYKHGKEAYTKGLLDEQRRLKKQFNDTLQPRREK